MHSTKHIPGMNPAYLKKQNEQNKKTQQLDLGINPQMLTTTHMF